jgi:hypothetical protein
MPTLRWKRSGNLWSSQLEPGRTARICENWVSPRRRSYTVTIGPDNFGETDALAAAKFMGLLASEGRLQPINAPRELRA